MGQGSSRPAREAERGTTAAASPRHGHGRSITSTRQTSTATTTVEEDGLLRGEHGGGAAGGSRRHPRRTGSANRLSQLLRWDPRLGGDLSGGDGAAHASPAAPEPARRSGFQRTATRFRNILSRTDTTSAHQRLDHADTAVDADARPSVSLRHPRPAGDPSDFYSPPRLPSIDISSTFDHDAFLAPLPAPAPHAHPDTLARISSSRRAIATSPLGALRSPRPFRHFTSSLRRRRSPAPSSWRSGTEDQAAMLSRLLSVAAAATAATLIGDDRQALSEARSLTNTAGIGELGAGGGEDGSFDGFLRALQNGRIASALRGQGGDGGPEGAGSRDGPLNFFRMFRFGASGSPEQAPLSTALGDASEAGDSPGADGRMVPIIIVGIRSITPTSGNGAGSAADELPPFIDALGNFPSPLPATHDSIDSILAPPQNGTSFRHRRRASMGGVGVGRSDRLSDRLDDQRDHRSPDRRRERPWSLASSTSNLEPRPPPATPASPSPELSRIPSRTSTPVHSRPASFIANSLRDVPAADASRRNSTLAPRVAPLSSHTEETASLPSTHSATSLLAPAESAGAFRFHTHRRSDTAPNIHYPRFSSGHPRRNGVVEPDGLPSLSRSSSASGPTSAEGSGGSGSGAATDSRSWIIYVLGGSYPENHPILTTPSLFTENPTYEDMMLLSALLGPAKAPVASEADVERAGGVYAIELAPAADGDARKTAGLVATATEGPERVPLESGQRCLVCLCDFEASEVARKLVKCGHWFHRECIDQVRRSAAIPLPPQ